MQHDHVLKKLNSDLMTPSLGSWVWGGLQAKFLLSCCCILDAIIYNLICNMTVFWKSWVMTYWHHPQGEGGGGAVGKIFATMLLHSWFSLIWYATWLCSEKVEIWTFEPTPKSIQGVRHRPSIKNHVWYVSYLLYLCLHALFFLNYWQLTELLRILNIWPLTPP